MCNNLRILLTLCFISTYVLKSHCYEPKDGNIINLLSEGDPCSLLHYGGFCTKVGNCTVAKEAIKNKGRHDLQRCGFSGNQEIVCCPDLSDRSPVFSSTTTEQYVFSGGGDSTTSSVKDNVGNQGRLKFKRKCEKMCEKIYLDNNIQPEIGYHILNGENAKVGQFPHAVALGFEESDGTIQWKCGASLISARFLLTAAHCFICNGCSVPKKARMGIIDVTDTLNAQDIDVKKATPHPGYNPGSKHNDIGLVELVRDAKMSKLLYPACLYTEADDPSGLQIVGWGQTVSNDASSKANILQYAVIEPVPISSCNDTLTSVLTNSIKVIVDTQICATTKSDACVGDSGGPLQILKEQGGYAVVGVISWGIQCGTKVPGIYTRVARYLDWIEQNVWPD